MVEGVVGFDALAQKFYKGLFEGCLVPASTYIPDQDA